MAIFILFLFSLFPLFAGAQSDLTSLEPKIFTDFKSATLEEARAIIQNQDVNKEYSCSTLLLSALANGINSMSDVNIEKIKLLLDAGADVNQETCELFPLMQAVVDMEGPKNLKNGLLNYTKQQVKQKSGYCYTLEKECKDVTSDDLANFENNLNIDYKKAQNNILPYTKKVLELLIHNGANINQTNKAGLTALHMAVLLDEDPSYEILQYLIKQGADVDIQAVSGYTALHSAAAQKKNKAIKILLNAGANPQLRNKMGQKYNELNDNDLINSINKTKIFEKVTKTVIDKIK